MKKELTVWMKRRKAQLVFTGILFILLVFWALVMPFEAAPDEGMRFQIPEYIARYHSLPDGRDEALRNPQWGISYGFGPQLTYILQAIFMSVMAVFTQAKGSAMFAARMVSVLAGTGTIWMSILISEKLFEKKFRKLFVALVSLLPQFLYLSTYINNDALALFGTAVIVYMWICGSESGWNIRSCIGLTAGIVICTLTYFNSYGFILCSIFFLFGSLFMQKKPLKEIAGKSLFIAALVLFLTSWYFIRNYFLYDGDILGMKISTEYAEMYAIDSLKPSMRRTPANTGTSLAAMFFGESQWFAVSWKSFVGVFGHMAVYMRQWQYYFYAFLFWIGAGGIFFRKKAGNRKRESRLFTGVMAAAGVIPFALSLYNSYYSDYQPQGRYLMPMLIPMMYFVTKGLQNVLEHFIKPEQTERVIRIITVILLGIMIYVYIGIWFMTYKDGLNLLT